MIGIYACGIACAIVYILFHFWIFAGAARRAKEHDALRRRLHGSAIGIEGKDPYIRSRVEDA